MKARTHQRICAWCHAGIAEQRPVFLVANTTGQIIGPYHAGCAERLKIEASKHAAMRDALGGTPLGTWPSIREETLPE